MVATVTEMHGVALLRQDVDHLGKSTEKPSGEITRGLFL